MNSLRSEKPQTCVHSVPENICAILLVGGMGKRLRSVLPATPKPLAPVGKKSFLHLVVGQLRSQCVHRLVMCTGYLADQINDEFGDGHELGLTIDYSKESCPLGTAGAVKLAERCLSAAPDFLVMNGDSFLELDFRELVRFHREHRALISIAVRKVGNAARYGTVQVEAGDRVSGFTEKTGTNAPGLVNAGVYVFNRDVLQHIPDGPASLERDVFPRLLGHGVYALERHGMFIDIGTPEDYARAQDICDRLYQAAIPKLMSGSNDRQPR
jgi:D-glycero-alpha-D-manno-heptose 1-phosphate guanylyltransferase